LVAVFFVNIVMWKRGGGGKEWKSGRVEEWKSGRVEEW
jgi:hypothetical protein